MNRGFTANCENAQENHPSDLPGSLPLLESVSPCTVTFPGFPPFAGITLLWCGLALLWE
jgi:hypothetical protein